MPPPTESTLSWAEYRDQRHVLTAKVGPGGSLALTPSSTGPRPWVHAAFGAFLPDGFPDSVTPDYLGFQLWDSLQALCSYVRGVITSKAILTGIGVGSEAATPLSAVFHFFVRDLTGMLGGVAFACCQGSGLDAYAKQWRLFADCFNNVGYALELASPHFPNHFLLLACLGNTARAITGVAAGATRAALTQHFATRGNAADVAAKEGSQETATTLVGLLVGMAITHLAAGLPAALWAVFAALTLLHIAANVRAVRALRLTSLNRPRVDLLVADFLRSRAVAEANGPERESSHSRVAEGAAAEEAGPSRAAVEAASGREPLNSRAAGRPANEEALPTEAARGALEESTCLAGEGGADVQQGGRLLSPEAVAAAEPLFPPPLWRLLGRDPAPLTLCGSLASLRSPEAAAQLARQGGSAAEPAPYMVVRGEHPPGDFIFWATDCSPAAQLESYVLLLCQRRLPAGQEADARRLAKDLLERLRAQGVWDLRRVALDAGPYRYRVKRHEE